MCSANVRELLKYKLDFASNLIDYWIKSITERVGETRSK